MKRPALRPEQLWLVLMAGMLLAMLVGAAGYGITKYRWATDTLASVEPRHARLLGLQAAERQMAGIETQLKASLAHFAYPADGDSAQIGNAALQRVRDVATSRGMRVTSSQVMPAKEDGQFDRIGLILAIEGEWPQFQALAQELATQAPVIFSDNLHLTAQQVGMPGQVQTMVARVGLFVLKARP